MPDIKYLYGASVQGIQQFIFQTNKLVEIAGASELVENICTDLFRSFLGEDFNKGELIIGAAGNIKYLFNDKNLCRKAYLEFPKIARSAAPGITISQAVVEVDSINLSDALSELESTLRAQRNFQPRSTMLGLMGIKRSRRSGLPAVKIDKKDGEYEDAATIAKQNAAKLLALSKEALREDITYDNITHDISSWGGKNNWIAVCHVDGNGLGSIVKYLASDKDRYAKFSKLLDKSTKAAAKSAYAIIAKQNNDFDGKVIPIRPVVLGGDDFTVICRGDFALEYIKIFIEEFEKETAKNLYGLLPKGLTKLSASAGIAFIKSSYPFIFAYNLAESLCSAAKDDSREYSSIMFHKVQDSFVEDYKDISKRELWIRDAGISFRFGPYYVSEPKNNTKWTVSDLLNRCAMLQGDIGNSIKSGLRNWLSLLSKDRHMADQKLDRIKYLASKKGASFTSLINDATTKIENAVPAYDILAINTILHQVSSSDNDDE